MKQRNVSRGLTICARDLGIDLTRHIEHQEDSPEWKAAMDRIIERQNERLEDWRKRSAQTKGVDK